MKRKKMIVTLLVLSMAVSSAVAMALRRAKKKGMTFMNGKSYFSIEELSRSATARRLGINNTPPPDCQMRLQALIDDVLNPVRRTYGAPISVNSGYRCPALNCAINGARGSQHMRGEAADITGGTVAKNRKLFEVLVALGRFDQLIWEYGGEWIHVSWKRGGYNRAEMLACNGHYTRINNTWRQTVLNAYA